MQTASRTCFASIVLTGFVAACGVTIADDALLPPQIEDLYKTDTVAGAVILGDGRSAIYVRQRVDPQTRAMKQSLWLVDDKGGPRVLEAGEPDASSPMLSPDGKWIVFLSTRAFSDGTPAFTPVPPYSDPAADLWLIPVEGGQAIPLGGKAKPYGRVITDTFYGRVSFSPDGRRLMFVADDGQDPRTERERRNNVVVVREDQGEGYEGYGPAQVWVADLLDTPTEVAAKNIARLTPGDFWYGDPQWSPDGSFVVVHANRTAEQESVRYSINHNYDLWKITLEDKRLERLTTGPGPEFSPRISPDGKRIVCLSSPRKGPHRDVFNLMVVELAPGGATSRLIFDHHAPRTGAPPHLPPEPPLPDNCWRNSHRVTFQSASGVKTVPQTVDLDAGPQSLESPPLPAPKRSPLLPASNPGIGKRLRAEDEFVHWTSFDGLEIEGVLTRPPESVASPPYRLLVMPHGGPHHRATSGAGFDVQFFATRGYAVFQPNFRGSTGYGLRFLDADRNDFGGGDMKDILTGIDFLVQQGIADRERQFVYGISYGGYMTSWLVGQTNQFRAAVAQNAVTDLNVMWHLSDLQSWTEHDMSGMPWDVPERLRERSPLTHAHKVRTPTLILHATNDRRCPVAMGRMFYRALRESGAETQLVLYPEEGHPIKQLPHREDVLTRVLEWFEMHTPAAETKPTAQDSSRVGDAGNGRIIVPTNQVLSPAGRQVAFSGRPTDVARSLDGRWLAVLDRGHVAIIDPEAARLVSRVPHAGGSFAGIVFAPDAKRLYASNIRGSIGVFSVDETGNLKAGPPIPLPVLNGARSENPANSETGAQSPNKEALQPGADSQNAVPVGLALDPDGKTLWAVLNMRNSLAQIDLIEAKVVREIPVGNAPYGVVLVGGRAYVSNWAGRHPGQGDPAAESGSGSPVRVDPTRYIANDGSVSVVDLNAGKELKQIVVGLHPAGIAATPDGRHVLVACANSDTLSVIDTAGNTVIETISVRPADKLLFGSAPNALAISSDGKRVYVSNGSNNAIAVIEFIPGKSRLAGCIPTAWYPAGLALDESRKSLYVANVKGIGSRNVDWKGSRTIGEKRVSGYNTHDHLGTISLIPLPTADELAEQTRTVLANNRLTESISALAPPRKDVPPRPVPERHGEPSVFKHVLYIIKENRTYDQVFGDIERGEGDPELCIYGRQITPNHHKLVDEFVLLDNFYCSGVLSADGHQWTNEAYVTDYIEKAFGGFPRSYPYWGGDAMAYAHSGFIWDNVLAHKKSLRVYGEFVKAKITWKDPAKKDRPTFLDCYRDFIDDRQEIEIQATAAIESLQPWLCRTAIGFPSIVPDIHRAAQFTRELKEFEAKGELPNFMIMLLPNDHTSGTRPGMPTPAAAIADNDLALGRIVEAVSRSKFWPETCIFVVQDDPQNGFDHIDGHRTVALVISPYTRRKALDTTNYNQTSMVRTMELILGLPPMNQFDASATPMTSCFTDKIDLTPYTAVPNNIPLDQLNPKVADIRDPGQRHWAQVSLKLPLDDIDEADEDTLNRVLWHAARGRDDTYPAWAVLEAED